MQDRYVSETRVPDVGQMVAVAKGVYWLRMPLPLALDHINLYLLEDHGGWYLVDSGIFCEGTCDHLRPLLRSGLNGKPLSGVLVTHHHPDHLGCAGWLAEQANVPVWISEPEYRAAHGYLHPGDGAEPDRQRTFYLRTGTGAAEADDLLRLQSRFAGYYAPLLTPPCFLEPGQGLLIGGRRWEVRLTSGHSPGHVCLYCPQSGLLISGDQILPLISSNVGVYGDSPDANPLQEWLASLDSMLVLPDDTLVLPAHNFPFRGLQRRTRELIEGHRSTLEQLRSVCTQPLTAAQLALQLYPMATLGFERMLALGETLAHLHYLVDEGVLRRRSDQAGQYRFEPTEPVFKRS